MLSAPIELRLNSLTGALLNVNFDSGLAFSPNGSRLFALTENGVLYEILQFNDDLNVAGLGLADGKAVAKKLFTATNLQNQYNAGTADFEGLAIVDEPAAASASTLAVSDGNSEDEVIYGGAGNDRLFGRGGDDQIFGKEGNDFIWGNRGDDLLRGGLGNDILKGDTLLDRGTDTFVLATGEGTDTIVDFTIDEDLIGLADGLTYEDLSISQTGTNTTIGFDNETLAVLRGVDASELIAAADNSFVIV
jgi:Ca2+-binding RTX toxin-like protein